MNNKKISLGSALGKEIDRIVVWFHENGGTEGPYPEWIREESTAFNEALYFYTLQHYEKGMRSCIKTALFGVVLYLLLGIGILYKVGFFNY